MIPVTGTQYTIGAGDYEAVVTGLGAGLRTLNHRGRGVLDGYPSDELPPGAAGQLLLPWPNRVDGGRYAIAGTSYQLDLSEPRAGNAIHGLTRWSTWSLARRSRHEVWLSLALLGHAGYPFCIQIEVGYHLDPDTGLRCTVTAHNTGSRPAPYGAGAHPYLSTGVSVDECRLELPAARWLPTDSRGIPDGPLSDVTGTELDFRAGALVGTTRLDHSFTGLTRDSEGRAWARLTGGSVQVTLWAGPGYGWLQAFSGDTLAPGRRRRALAVEPMTCPPNAFASGTDLLVLDPGDAVTHTWGIAVSDAPATG